MILSRDEVIINEWEYAIAKRKRVETKHALVVTNKRIVSTVESKRKITQREIPVNSVQNISVMHETPSLFGPVLAIVLGVLFMIIGAVAAFLGLTSFKENLTIMAICLGAGALLIIVGLIMIIVNAKRLNQGAFMLELSSNMLQEHELMSVGFDKMFGSRRTDRGMRLYINNDVARDIIDKLGAIIIDNK